MGSDRHLNRSEFPRFTKLLEEAECGGTGVDGGGCCPVAALLLMKGCGKGKGGLLPGRLLGEK